MFPGLSGLSRLEKLSLAEDKLYELAEKYTHMDCLYRSGSENAGRVVVYVRGDDDTLYVSNLNLDTGKKLGKIKATDILPKSIKSKVMVEELVKENKEIFGNTQFDIYHVFNDTDIFPAAPLEEYAAKEILYAYFKSHPGLQEKIEDEIKQEFRKDLEKQFSRMSSPFAGFGMPVMSRVVVLGNPDELDENGNLKEEYFRTKCPTCSASKMGCINYLNAKKLYDKK
jgi:hypothetical protein